MEGTIKKLNEKGFGFIAIDGEDTEVFFHQSGLVGIEFNELRGGEKVSFDKEDSEKGPRAINVKVVA